MSIRLWNQPAQEMNLLLTTVSKMQMSFLFIHLLQKHRSNISFYEGWIYGRAKLNHGGWKSRNEVRGHHYALWTIDGGWICIRRAKGESPDSFTKLVVFMYKQSFFFSIFALFSPSELPFRQPPTEVSSQFLFECCLRLSFFLSFTVSASVHFRKKINCFKCVCVWVCLFIWRRANELDRRFFVLLHIGQWQRRQLFRGSKLDFVWLF